MMTSSTQFTWLAAIGELFFTHSSTIFTTARRILASVDFSMRDVRIACIKFFLISMLITARRVFTRSRLSITSSLVPATDAKKKKGSELCIHLWNTQEKKFPDKILQFEKYQQYHLLPGNKSPEITCSELLLDISTQGRQNPRPGWMGLY